MSAITPDLIAAHQLTPGEYDKIVSLLGREPMLHRVVPVVAPEGREQALAQRPEGRRTQEAVADLARAHRRQEAPHPVRMLFRLAELDGIDGDLMARLGVV